MTLQQLGDKIGITPTALSNIENGKTNPSNQTILSICRVFGVSEHWLRTGEGEMYVKKSKDEEIMALFNEAMQDEPDTRRRQMLAAMYKWREEDWEAMAHLAESLTKGKE